MPNRRWASWLHGSTTTPSSRARPPTLLFTRLSGRRYANETIHSRKSLVSRLEKKSIYLQSLVEKKSRFFYPTGASWGELSTRGDDHARPGRLQGGRNGHADLRRLGESASALLQVHKLLFGVVTEFKLMARRSHKGIMRERLRVHNSNELLTVYLLEVYVINMVYNTYSRRCHAYRYCRACVLQVLNFLQTLVNFLHET